MHDHDHALANILHYVIYLYLTSVPEA